MANEKVDVVIVGAGASGSVYAAVLAKAGKKVVLVEAGPDWQLSDLISSDFWGRRIKPAGPPFLLEGKNPFGYVYQAGWGVGGAALHYFANFPRLMPTDFKVKSEHGKGLDWPINYADVAPYYDKVARDVGVSGDAKAEEIWRPAGEPYPMPPMKTFRGGEVWKKGFETRGIRLVPAAVGMNSTPYKGRPACIYDGWCHVGCPIGALANPLVTYLADARNAGAQVRAHATVTRVLANPKGDKVTGVEYFDAAKERQVQEASVVVLAAWSAQNPRLMLNSATDQHAKGLANASGLVGKYLTAHFASGTSAIFDDDLQPYMGTTARNTSPMTATTRTRTRPKARSAAPLSWRARRRNIQVSAASPIRAAICSGPSLPRSCSAPHAALPASMPSARRCRASTTASRSPATRTNSACRSARSPTAITTTRSRSSMPTSRTASPSPRRPVPRRRGRTAAPCRPSI